MSEEVLIVGNFSPPIADKLGEHYTLHQVASAAELDSVSQDVLNSVSGFATHGWAPVDVIDKMANLKMISSFGVGYDGVAAEHAASKGIMVGHTPDVLNDEVANTAIALILATDRRIVAYDKYVREGRWEKEGNAPLTRGLSGKKVGIVGLGRIGEALAEKLQVFHAKVGYHGRTEKADLPYKYYGNLVEMATNADILVVITPGGPATNKLISKEVIEALGPQGTLVNIARGTVVDEAAMVAALQDDRLGAAGLDVFENEPKVPAELLSMDNVVLAPHIGSATVETRQAMSDRVVENLIAFYDDGKPINLVPECNGLV